MPCAVVIRTSALTPEETVEQVVDHAHAKGFVTSRRRL
jgi:hypothetical protein